MKEVKRNFTQRKKEIETYFEFLEKILNNNIINWEDNSQERISGRLRRILKANIFLLLYNLAESSISAAIEQIHLSIENDVDVSFDDIKDQIKIDLIKNLKNNKNPEKFIKEINQISTDIITSCFIKKKLFPGNLDSCKIREVAKKYGFSTFTDFHKTKNGEKLKKVKDNRNDLAHGVFSFEDIGKHYTLPDIKDYKEEIISYLEQIIDNIEKYIDNKEYKIKAEK